MSLLLSVGLLAFAALELVATRRQAVEQVALTQEAQVLEVSGAVRGALESIKLNLTTVTTLPWEIEGWLTLQDRRHEYRRLLKLLPAVDSVRWVGADGKEQLFVSRREVDRIAAEPKTEGAVRLHGGVSGTTALHYVQGFDPTLSVALEGRESGSDSTFVDINLRSLSSGLAASLTLAGRTVYVADGEGRIMLHKDPGVMVRRTAIADRSHFRSDDPAAARVVPSRGLDGGEVLVSSMGVGMLGWRVYVEQPTGEALQPVDEAVARTAVLALIWLAVVVSVGLYLSRRLTRPIAALARGAAALASGDLRTRIEVDSQDELQDLAMQFNAMADSLQQTISQQEQRIAEKTQALEVANRHKSEFLTNMSHELRTPLNAVIGMSEVLAEQEMCGPLTAKQLEYMTDIHNSGTHLLALINEILDMSKVESGRMELDRVVVDVGSQVTQAVALVRDRADRQGVQLVTTVAPDPCEWRVDPQRFRQILLNLLSNAVKFTACGGRVSLDARIEARGLVVEVGDTGRGIAREHLPLVFEPFRQFGAQPGLPVEGTGLGLALVKRLVELHGGSITLDSEPGRGSRFTLVFPQDEA
ncbi:hybrid sensor histidine kinase/response regulator [uncultured Methylibium sp.]|uniref:hybrid sensor histidine kinase/response regulator n=1 Tax=uncultured Methylibium sp. TaxID=381093 RepID=UPI0025F5052F|nr:hybrid sensor histidine kinase/response regulator [uncultured Methylibium sp.]